MGLPWIPLVMFDRLAALIGRRPDPVRRPRPSPSIPPEIGRRLQPDNADEPLFPQLRAYGRGRPGVTQEREEWWVIRDDRGRVVGGAVVGDIGLDHPVAIDVAVDPRRQGEGWATRLYGELERRGIDMEAGSAASLAHTTMTPDGYRFMRARRTKADPDAESKIVVIANICPGCGPMDDRGRPLDDAAD
jgi:GNAT superfamily N-acetyltransferase